MAKRGIERGERYVSQQAIARDYGGKVPPGARPSATGKGYYVSSGRGGRKAKQAPEAQAASKPEIPDTPGASNQAPKVGEKPAKDSLLNATPKPEPTKPPGPKAEKPKKVKPAKDAPQDQEAAFEAAAQQLDKIPGGAEAAIKHAKDNNFQSFVDYMEGRAKPSKAGKSPKEKPATESAASTKEDKPSTRISPERAELARNAYNKQAEKVTSEIELQLKRQDLTPADKEKLQRTKDLLTKYTSDEGNPPKGAKTALADAKLFVNPHAQTRKKQESEAKVAKRKEESEAKAKATAEQKSKDKAAKQKDKAAKQAETTATKEQQTAAKQKEAEAKKKEQTALRVDAHKDRAKGYYDSITTLMEDPDVSDETKAKLKQTADKLAQHASMGDDEKPSREHLQDLRDAKAAISEGKKNKAEAVTAKKQAEKQQKEADKMAQQEAKAAEKQQQMSAKEDAANEKADQQEEAANLKAGNKPSTAATDFRQAVNSGQKVERVIEEEGSSELASQGLSYGATGAVSAGHSLLGGDKEKEDPKYAKPSPFKKDTQSEATKKGLYLNLDSKVAKAVSTSTSSEAKDTNDPKKTKTGYKNSFDRRPVGAAASANPVDNDPDVGRRWAHGDDENLEDDLGDDEESSLQKSLFDVVNISKSIFEECAHPYLRQEEVDFITEMGYDLRQMSKGMPLHVRRAFDKWQCDRLRKSCTYLERFSK